MIKLIYLRGPPWGPTVLQHALQQGAEESSALECLLPGPALSWVPPDPIILL